MSKEAWITCNTCHLCYQSTTKGVEKQACPISIRIVRMDFDASCDENGPSKSRVEDASCACIALHA
jgi:hypothetical protein